MNPDPAAAALRRPVEIRNALGLHLRPAEKFVKTADRFQADIRVWYKGQSRDGRSILDLATIGAECGTQLELEATGADAEAALTALIELIAADFFEDEYGQDIVPRPARNGTVPAGAAEPAAQPDVVPGASGGELPPEPTS